MQLHLVILLAALLIDWFVGDPDWLWRRLSHPVVFFGKFVAFLDRSLNRETDPPVIRRQGGAFALLALLAVAVLGGLVIAWFLRHLGLFGTLLELAIVVILLAQKSLADHVGAVAVGLRLGGLAGGRKAVSMIVGRDPQTLDRAGVSRAGIESLAENFSDGVVAPAFWYALLGLPGILAYKMLNTADSMIGHRTEKYLDFGRWSARADDFANFVPARLSVVVIALGALSLDGLASARAAAGCALRDAGLHRSPNAGWPEAAFAGSLGFALGGPRIYAGESVHQAWLNGAGKIALDAADVDRALVLFARACFALWAVVFLFILAG